jgi:uncharacterized protein
VPEETPEGRYIVVDGRRWRKSDPSLSEERRQEVALGERGPPWWERKD